MYEILIVVYLIVSIALVGMILIQQGKGADMGASFGAGASATLFGSSGSGNFLTKTTAILATLFFVLSIFIGAQTANSVKQEDTWENLEVPAETIPAASEELPVEPAPTENKDEIPVG